MRNKYDSYESFHQARLKHISDTFEDYTYVKHEVKRQTEIRTAQRRDQPRRNA